MEVGYALALKVPVWSSGRLTEIPFGPLIDVASEEQLINELRKILTGTDLPSEFRLSDLQNFYRHVALLRGWQNEAPEHALIGLIEEVGELAKAIRTRLKMSVKKDDVSMKSLDLEMADCLNYLLHMANQANIDLMSAFLEKERMNVRKAWSPG
jgi:NTP pyrophosphatase (non-canonical NTP hydrolase)